MHCISVALQIKEELLKNLIEIKIFKKIILVSPTKPNSHLIKKYKNKIEFRRDDEFYTRHEFDQLLINEKKNWYYQQFLKYKILEKIEFDYALLIDGDSRISKNIISIYQTSHLTVVNRKLIKQYNNFLKSFRIHESKFNFITNEMLFQKEKFNDLLEYTKNQQNSKNWELAIAKNINADSYFSEYQLYGSFIFSKYSNLKISSIKSFRRFDLINAPIKNALKYYDLVSLENSHKSTLLKRVVVRLMYNLKMSIG